MGGENEKSKLEEKVKDLEEKIKRLERGGGEEPESVAGGILEEVGGMIPGLGGLIKALGKSDAFRQRLTAVDKEIERKLEGEPLKKGDGVTPRFNARFSAHTLAREESSFEVRGGRRSATPAGREVDREAAVEMVEEPAVDIFDEEGHITVICEVPGAEEKDITVDLAGQELLIAVNTPIRKYRKEVILPCSPRGEVERVYRNGVLEITLRKG